MQLDLYIKNTENIGILTVEQKMHIQEIVEALLQSGGLTGVKGGQTIIHFDASGEFQKIELKYFPWSRKSRR